MIFRESPLVFSWVDEAGVFSLQVGTDNRGDVAFIVGEEGVGAMTVFVAAGEARELAVALLGCVDAAD